MEQGTETEECRNPVSILVFILTYHPCFIAIAIILGRNPVSILVFILTKNSQGSKGSISCKSQSSIYPGFHSDIFSPLSLKSK